jgi:hypothetical protein
MYLTPASCQFRPEFFITKTKDEGKDVIHEHVTCGEQKAVSESLADLVGQDQVHDKGNCGCEHCQNAKYDTEAVSITAGIYNVGRYTQDYSGDDHGQRNKIVGTIPALLI